MIIGFTGTRNGLSPEQGAWLFTLLEACRMDGYTTGLHGDCIGADATFDSACRKILGPDSTICRPCTFEHMRAWTGAKIVAEPDSPMRRNRAIVVDADVMIACPPNDTPIKHGSGTWATIGFAKKAGKPLAIVFPDGRVEKSGGWGHLNEGKSFQKGGP